MTDDIFHVMDDRCSVVAAANPITATDECIWPGAAAGQSWSCLNGQSNFHNRLLPSLLSTSKQLLIGNSKMQTMSVATEVKKIVSRKRRTI